jgi:uncharacterized protein YdeI (BOF family)
MSVKKVAVYVSVFSAGALAVVGALALGGLYPAQVPLLVAPTGSASNSADIPAASSPASSDVTPIGSLVRNTFVTVEGTVQRVTDEDEFVVADSTGSIKVWTGTTFGAVAPGERVLVRGFVDDDLLIEIYAQEIVKEDGTVLELRSYGG